MQENGKDLSDLHFLKHSLSVFSAGASEAGTDNRNIVDDGKSQKLTRDDIETLKEQGLKGQVHEISCSFKVSPDYWVLGLFIKMILKMFMC